MSFFENTRKPVGLGGKIMVAMMNFGHSAMAEWGLRFLQPTPDAVVLDCGCGGGAHIKTLLKLCPNGKVQGIDYSAVSVEKARKVNAGAIADGRCNVQQASVAELPFEAEQFDVAVSYTHLHSAIALCPKFIMATMIFPPRPAGLRVFSKKDTTSPSFCFPFIMPVSYTHLSSFGSNVTSPTVRVLVRDAWAIK